MLYFFSFRTGNWCATAVFSLFFRHIHVIREVPTSSAGGPKSGGEGVQGAHRVTALAST